MTRSYTLSEFEQRVVTHIGRARYLATTKAGHALRFVDRDKAERGHVVGFGAEYAYCRIFNACPDLSIGAADSGFDVEHLGKRIDIKSTERPGGCLVVPVHRREHAADVYVLMLADWPRYTYAGYATAAEIAGHVRDLGHGPSLVMGQDELHADDIGW